MRLMNERKMKSRNLAKIERIKILAQGKTNDTRFYCNDVDNRNWEILGQLRH